MTGIGTVPWHSQFPQMFTVAVYSVQPALHLGTAGSGGISI